jgi:hypothetical protein
MSVMLWTQGLTKRGIWLTPEVGSISVEVDGTSGGLLVSWDAVGVADTYNVYYAIDGGTWQSASTGETGTSYNFVPTIVGEYSFAVTAVRGTSESAKVTLTPTNLFDDVPVADGISLMAFYEAMGGDNWTTNTNWMTDSTVGNWYGVTVSGGRVTRLDLSGDANVDGTFALSDLPTGMQYLSLSSTQSVITGALSDLPTGMQQLYLHSTQSVITGGASAIVAKGIQIIRLENTSLDQAKVNDILTRLYTDRTLFTDATPELNIDGTAIPSGTYQYSASPSTALEYAYALEHDDDSEGFKLWDITYKAA